MGKAKIIIKRIIITNHYKALKNIALLIKINILKGELKIRIMKTNAKSLQKKKINRENSINTKRVKKQQINMRHFLKQNYQ